MKTTEQFVITINRELGSGGRTIGSKVAERLGVPFYDKALMHELTQRFHISSEELEKVKSKKRTWWDDMVKAYTSQYDMGMSLGIEPVVPTTDSVFLAEYNFLNELAEEASCVIAGRSGFHIFRDEPNVLHILITSSMHKRVERVMQKQGLTEKEAKAVIEKVDKGRETYMKEAANASRYDTRNYDLVINVANLTEDEAADVIMDFINKQDK